MHILGPSTHRYQMGPEVQKKNLCEEKFTVEPLLQCHLSVRSRDKNQSFAVYNKQLKRS